MDSMLSLVVVVLPRGRFTRSLRDFWKLQGSVRGAPKASSIGARERLVASAGLRFGRDVATGTGERLDDRIMTALFDDPSIAAFEQGLQVARLIAPLLARDLR